jgi:glycosyltransferase involved in cell wall biosynthesis
MSVMNPKLTIDVAPLLEDFWTGIPVFTRRLIYSLTRHGGIDLDFTYNFARLPPDRVYAAMRLGSGSFLREDFETQAPNHYELIDPAVPIFFPSAKGHCGGRLKREASTIHDMSTLFLPDTHDEANIAYHLDHISDELASDEVVFCISQATRAALVTAFPSVASKTRLLYQFADWPDEFELLDRNLPPIKLGRYAVVVGTVEPRKNLQILIDALSLPELTRENLTFLVIGKKGWRVDGFLENLTAEQRKRLVFSGFVSEFIKYRLIKNAEFLIFPSLYEGFGIPALEAMSLGKPVLASRTSSFSEVIGEAGVFFDPLSPTAFAAALAEIADERKLRELAPKAVLQNSTFGWERMAKPIVDWVRG